MEAMEGDDTSTANKVVMEGGGARVKRLSSCATVAAISLLHHWSRLQGEGSVCPIVHQGQ